MLLFEPLISELNILDVSDLLELKLTKEEKKQNPENEYDSVKTACQEKSVRLPTALAQVQLSASTFCGLYLQTICEG